MNRQNKLSKYLLPIGAFLSAWASVRACRLSTFHLFGGLLFLFYLLLGNSLFQWKKAAEASEKIKITSAILSFLFTALYLCADYDNLLDGLSSRLFQAGILCISAAGLFLLFFALLFAFFLWIRDISPFSESKEQPISSRFEQHFFLFSFFVCLICWLPYFLTNYPGIMTVDSLNQYGQIIGKLPMSNHHPWTHTQLIRLFYELGMMLTGDAIFGLGLYTLFQMLVMAAIFAYFLDTLRLLSVKRSFCLAALAFYSLLPYNGIYMVTMWKDILFSGMTLLFSTVLFRFLMHTLHDSFTLTCRTKILYVISGISMCLLRSNGFYAFLLTLPFLFLCFYKEWKKQLCLNLLILGIVLTVKIPLLNALQVASADFVESLSIPIQQVARVYAEQEAVCDKDNEMWNRIMDTSQISSVYEPFCSDHMKNLIRQGNQDYLTAHKGDYLKLWLRFGLSHPKAYALGYLDATKGYWYPDIPNIIGSDEGIAQNSYGLSARPFLHSPLTIKIKEIVFKLPDIVPIYGLLFSLGAMFWLSLILAGASIINSGRKLLLVFLPNAAIMATLFLATPVNNEFRYAYSLLLTIPLFWLCAFYHPVSAFDSDSVQDAGRDIK